ncbi:MAG: hypothetical protein CVT47_02500 [Thermoplasmata archaeon HGW-Thermoplasmata-2]|nr:MAG: hypothetical protein CVT47_02500 [Thermoplasmata archaeon HGW-Thermoplasmata-2]
MKRSAGAAKPLRARLRSSRCVDDRTILDKFEKHFANTLIKRDLTHEQFIEAWAAFVKSNPRRIWKKQQKEIIDSQIIMANRFYRRLSKTKGGLEKIKQIMENRV